MIIENMPLIAHDTVRKSRDPAILDSEQLFLQLKIEEIFSWQNFFNSISKIISGKITPIHVRQNKQHHNFIAYHP